MREMRRLTFLLSGEHPTIPASEALASIEAEGFDYDEIENLDQVLTVKTATDPVMLSERLGMSHWIGEHFCTFNFEELEDAIGSSDLIDFLPQSKSISVRVKRVKQYSPEIDTRELSEKIADIILEGAGYEVDLENPDSEIILVLTEGRCILTLVQARIERTEFEERRPPERAATHPSTMQPNLARALVNLARTPRDGTFLDPFCGVGGILLEAGLIGAKPMGVDINSDLLEGAEENLEETGIRDFDLREGDARELDVEKVDAIATDPPYGRQASTGGSEVEEIYEETLPVLSRVLKQNRYLCISAPAGLELDEMVDGLPLEFKEKHYQRVHKSLERNIYVFRREEE